MMMLAFFLMAQAATVSTPARPNPATPVSAQMSDNTNEILVMAQKLKKLSVTYSIEKTNGIGAVKNCRVKRSSGDAEIDAVACQAVEYCVGQLQLTFGPSRKCVKTRGRALIEELRDRRSRASDAE
jgi:hypothetical protein